MRPAANVARGDLFTRSVLGRRGRAPSPGGAPSSPLWLRMLIEQVGFELREVMDDGAAPAVFDAPAPHLVRMDLRLPVMDGYAATRAIWARPAGRAVVASAVSS